MVVVQLRGSPTTNTLLRKIRVINGKQVHETRGTVAVQLRSSPEPSQTTSKVIMTPHISRAPPTRRGIGMKTGNRQTSGKRNDGETQRTKSPHVPKCCPMDGATMQIATLDVVDFAACRYTHFLLL